MNRIELYGVFVCFYVKFTSEYTYLKIFGQVQYTVMLAKSTQVCHFLPPLFYFFSPWKTPEGVPLCTQVRSPTAEDGFWLFLEEEEGKGKVFCMFTS